eukprot:jgi/Orpsp1_1/1187772/evm.model.d7180000060042.1
MMILKNEFFNHPLISFPSVYLFYYHYPMERLEKQLPKAFDIDVFKSIDFSFKVNLSKDEKNYFIHKYSIFECSYGRFSRSFSITENANINDIQAKMKNGTLEVILSKINSPKPETKHTIQIQ